VATEPLSFPCSVVTSGRFIANVIKCYGVRRFLITDRHYKMTESLLSISFRCNKIRYFSLVLIKVALLVVHLLLTTTE
jgi:hypothetical protein